MNRRPRLEDVARQAGVSLGTVSNTLNNPSKVREEVRARIHTVIEELGWVRNEAARTLAAGTSRTVGIVLVDLGNSLFVDLARGAEQEFRRHGFRVLIADSAIDWDKEREAVDTFAEAQVAGLLIAPFDSPTGSAIHERARGPVVLVNYAAAGTSSVVVDEHLGGRLAAAHLVDTGHRRLVFVGGPMWLDAVRQRYEGARDVAEARGVHLELLETNALEIAHGRDASRRLEKADATIDGVICASDLLAVGVIQDTLDRRGLRVPDELAVVGYDNNLWASESSLPLSTIAQPRAEMGRTAAALLIEQILDSTVEARTVLLEPQLIVRSSSSTIE